MAIEHYVKVAGAWRDGRQNPSHYVKVAGSWQEARPTPAKYVKVVGRWRGVSDPPPVLPPGTYTLSPTAQSIGQQTAYAEFNTVEYRGRITAIWAVISWHGGALTDFSMSCSGRHNGNYYRQIDNNGGEWNGRTISHRIDSFDASSLTDFNNGNAIGFNFAKVLGLNLEFRFNNVKLQLQIT